MDRIKGLDGLRALAVLSVMFFHLGWHFFSFGWAGVPFFFVLSGYLITGILLDNKGQKAGHYFGTFYVRRVLRIFPLYYFYLGTIFLWCRYLGIHGSGWGYFLSYLQNYWLGANQFKLIPGEELGHTWSLAVEEQFYFIWPLILYLLPVRWLKNSIYALVVGSAVSEYLISTRSHFVAFAPLSSNLGTLCLGGFIAILARESRRRLQVASACLLLAGAVAIVCLFVNPARFSFGRAVDLNASNPTFQMAQALFFTGIVGLVSIYRIPPLEWRPVVYIGKISYGLYIWHAFGYHLVSVAEYRLWIARDSPWVASLMLLLSFSFAAASYRFLEGPILKVKTRFSYKGDNLDRSVRLRAA